METVLLLIAGASFFLYFPMEAHRIKGHRLKTPLDAKIPLVPLFVFPYIFFFPYVVVTIIWAYLTQNPEFPQLAVSLLAVSIFTTAIYIGYPSMMVRPFTRGRKKADHLTEKIVEEIEKFDKPNNVFPSNHVAYSLVVTLFLVLALPSLAWLFWIIFSLIAASTVLIKQHYIIDVPAGAALALICWYVAGYFL